MTKRKNKRRQPQPLAPPIHMKSRKKARKVTTEFHKLTRLIEIAKKKKEKQTHTQKGSNYDEDDINSEIQSLEAQIEAIGGREAYQKASQLNTSFHSTSRWVLGVLGEFGWLQGIPLEGEDDDDRNEEERIKIDNQSGDGDKQGNFRNELESSSSSKGNSRKRCCRVLEVGAINAEMVDAASSTRRILAKKQHKSTDSTANNNEPNKNNGEDATQTYIQVPKYNLSVRAIDLRSTHPKIEEADFLTFPILQNSRDGSSGGGYFDAIICSMVLNCVPTAQDRGRMLSRMYRQLRPGGLCFLTIPRLCLSQSKYLNQKLFEDLLVKELGFDLERKRESPKVAFFVLKRPSDGKNMTIENDNRNDHSNNSNAPVKWSKLRIINKGQKFRNEFGVILSKHET